MSSNPPLPYETINETEYAGWHEMINSIVSFVTASTQLASSLRNSRGCFPEAGELTDQRRRKRENLEMFNPLDFPWFLDQLKDIVISDISLPQFTVAEYVPMVHYPFLDDIHGEPNNEPRTFTLVDTQDFGDVDVRMSSNSVISIHKPKRSFGSISSADKTKPYMKYKNSNDSCFFEEYSESEQTIDSCNLQEKFENDQDEDGSFRRNSRFTENNRNFVQSDESVRKYRNCETEEKEQLSTIYDEPEHRNSKNVELFMECTVEDTVLAPKKKKVSNENVYVYEAGNVVSTCSEIVQVEKNLDTQDVGTDYKSDIKEMVSTEATQADLLPVAQVESVDKNTQVLHKRKKKDLSKTRETDKEKKDTKQSDSGKSKVSLISDGAISANKKKIQKKTENETIAESSLVKKSVKLQEKIPLKKKIQDTKINVTKNKNNVEINQSTKDVLSARESKREKEGEIDYITKNIVNCLNIAKKTNKPPNEKPKLANKIPIKSLNNILKDAELNKSITPNIQSQIIASANVPPQSRKPTNKKSFSVDTVTPKEPGRELSLPKKLAGTKKPIAKTASNNETSSKFDPATELAKSIMQSAEKTQEIKSCLRTGNVKNLGSQKICIIRDDTTTCGERKTGNIAVFSRSKDDDSIMPKMLIIRDTTLKLSAAENVKKASELLKNVDHKVLKSTIGVKRQVVSGTIRPMSAEPSSKRR